jgi:hypothetical protein
VRCVFIESASTKLGAGISFYFSVYTLPAESFCSLRQIILKAGRLGVQAV